SKGFDSVARRIQELREKITERAFDDGKKEQIAGGSLGRILMKVAPAQLVDEPGGLLCGVIQSEFVDKHRIQLRHVRSALCVNGGLSQLRLCCWDFLARQKSRQTLRRNLGVDLRQIIHQVRLFIDFEKFDEYVD